MSKPDDMPDDIWAAAEDPSLAAFDASVDLYETGMENANIQLIIAQAILDERVRCARIAEEFAPNDQCFPYYHVNDVANTSAVIGQNRASKSISQAIRNGRIT
jgi:hypothetical protein